MNLIEGIQKELNRNRELLKMYQGIGPAGTFGVQVIKAAIEEAEQAIANGDTVKMVTCYKKLQETE